MRGEVTTPSLLRLLRTDVIGSLVAVRWGLLHVEEPTPRARRVAAAQIVRALALVERVCSELERTAVSPEQQRRKRHRVRCAGGNGPQAP